MTAAAPAVEDAPATPGRAVGAVAWHAGFGLALAALVGLLMLVAEPTMRTLGAPAALALGAATVWAVLRMEGSATPALVLWALAAGVASALAGGPTFALGALACLAPALTGVELRAPLRGIAATLAATAAALLLAPHGAGYVASSPLAFWGLLAVTVGGALAATWRRGPAPRPLDAPPQAAPLAAAEAAPVVESEADALRRELAQANTARARAEAEARARAAFLANMSHELRTPLNAVIGFSDVMRQRLFGPLPDRYAEYAELIHESGGHLLALINDILDMSKIEADRYELKPERIDARDPLNAALRLMRRQAEEKGVRLRATLPPAPLTADADPRALKQIALNLLSNALKFTPPGGEVDVTLHAVAGDLELLVTDTGIGIAPEDLARLGEPYAQAEAGRAAGGTGLGLSLVKALAKMQGGFVLLESRLGEGAAVTVRLPVLVREAA